MTHFISLDTAKLMTSLYRAEKENVINPLFADKGILSISETFNRAAFDHVLSQPGCEGLRIYYGMSEDLKLHAIVVGVNSNNEDMLPLGGTAHNTTESEGQGESGGNQIIEVGSLCPPECAPPSLLNTP